MVGLSVCLSVGQWVGRTQNISKPLIIVIGESLNLLRPIDSCVAKTHSLTVETVLVYIQKLYQWSTIMPQMQK